MFRNGLLNRLVASIVALGALLTAASHRAEAQVVPFKVTGGGNAPDGLSIVGADSRHDATGKATHLGRYSGDEGIANVLSFDPTMGAGTFEGSYVFVAANGDRLAFTYGDTDNGAEQPGEFMIFDAGGGKVYVVFIAEFNPIPSRSTGRFKDVVDGSFIMIAVTEAFVPVIDEDGYTAPFRYTWEGEGWIEFKRGK